MGGLLLAVGLLHAPGQAGIGQQAGGEVPVALAVLGGDRACGQACSRAHLLLGRACVFL
ncbi:hypothetical protein XOCgx_4226 [Xanthomonas oryzae pv. oryzicola]|nr:hypothetical protein XOCgx_4226 [Xanthomonas oryzae pv. oryzicola]